MVGKSSKTIAPAIGAEDTLTALGEVRDRTMSLVSHLSVDDLAKVHSQIMSPLMWDLAHIAAYEDLWLVHRHAEKPLLRPDLAGIYDAFETPRSVRGEVKLLDVAETFRYMDEVRERSLATVEERGVGDGFLHELVLRHELQHTETMLQTMALADLLPPSLSSVRGDTTMPAPGAGESATLDTGESATADANESATADTGESPTADANESPTADANESATNGAGEPAREWLRFDAGVFTIGAPDEGFAYDNERSRHEVRLDAFSIMAEPVSEADWKRFEDEGGYERREWWSERGWEWRERTEVARHPIARNEPRRLACHISFHEAEAYATSQGARLPSEAEWEAAATASGARLGGVGEVWEWTSTVLDGYPGFAPYPYREYSEVFFKRGYQVLRGGSWAAHPRVATRTFRNWDLPERRQIFAGLRLAKDE